MVHPLEGPKAALMHEIEGINQMDPQLGGSVPTEHIIVNNDGDIEEIQHRLLMILTAVHELCERYSIRYYMVGGTLIGAVRHCGFIPWDDDIDIAMPRPDYLRFLKVAHELPAHLNAESFLKFSPDCNFPWIKCFDTSTTVVEDLAIPIRRGLWIDIFPLDGVPGNLWARAIQLRAVSLLRNLISLRTGAYYVRGMSRAKRYFAAALHIVLGIFPARPLFVLLDKFITLVPFDVNGQVANLLGRYGAREIVPGRLFESTVKLSFSEELFHAPKGFHDYLIAIYGDYMRLPPQENRVPSHATTEFDLGRGYTDF